MPAITSRMQIQSVPVVRLVLSIKAFPLEAELQLQLAYLIQVTVMQRTDTLKTQIVQQTPF